jgi:membrane protease YdiL (CAAX protease family)
MSSPQNESPLESTTKWERAAAGIAAIYPFFLTLFYFDSLDTAAPAIQQAAYTIGKSIQFLFPLWWVAIVLKQRWLLRPPRREGVFEGALFGVAVFGVVVMTYWLWLKPIGFLSPDSPAARAVYDRLVGLELATASRYLGFALFICILHSGLEEYYWRWFVFGQMRRFLSIPLAILLSSIAFMLHHVIILGTYLGYAEPATWIFSAGVAIGGAYWAWLYDRTANIWGAWLSHALIDAAIFLIGYDMIAPLL